MAKKEAEKKIEPNEVEILNDLQAAIEIQVNPGTGWKVLYPEAKHKFKVPPLDIAVRLREDFDICFTCRVEGSCALRASALGHFGPAAEKFIVAETRDMEREAQQQKARLRNREQYFLEQAWLLRRGIGFRSVVSFVLLGLFIGFVPVAHDYLAAVFLSFGAVMIFFFLSMVLVGSAGRAMASATVEAKRFRDSTTQSALFHHRTVLFIRILFALAASFLSGMAMLCHINGFPWVTWIFGAALLCGCIFYRLLFADELEIKHADERILQSTIVFEGSVLGSRPCVCSWPGKYESAWDALVQSSREGGMSAAVVFLPKGSQHYGSHDSIPRAEGLEGDCWCTPLYGEKKPWGCRWWTLWVANIEKAVQEGAELMVFFFEKKPGQGKVQSFLTAGQENLQRESIWRKRAKFEKSAEFRDAVEHGLEKLSREKRGDSSSRYTREWQRLFFAWLPEEDRKFLEVSEGLGNSQKAEVAWLDRKGYPYTAVEIDVAEWTLDQDDNDVSNPSPKVIDVVT